MKIAFVTHSFPESAEQDPTFPATWELSNALQRLGHEIAVFTFAEKELRETFKEYVQINGIHVWRKPLDRSLYTFFENHGKLPIFGWQLARARELYNKFSVELERFNPDVIESHEFYSPALFWSQNKKFPIVIRCYGAMSMLMRKQVIGKYLELDEHFVEKAEMLSIESADGLIAISNDVAEYLGSRGRRRKEEFEIIRVPLTVNEQALPATNTVSKESYPRIFYFGKISKLKGVDLLVQALPMVLEKFPNARLLMAGPDNIDFGDDKPYSQIAQEQLEELGIAAHAEIRGFLSRAAIKQLSLDYDVCVFPSKYETACYTCLEAVSYGAAVIATAVGGLPEYHIANKSAVLIEPNSPQALAQGIIDLCTNEELKRTLVAEGAKHVRQFCNPDLIAQETLKAYQRAIRSFSETSRNVSLSLSMDEIAQLLDESQQFENEKELAKAYKAGFIDGIKSFPKHVRNHCKAMIFEIASRSGLYGLARSIKKKLSQ